LKISNFAPADKFILRLSNFIFHSSQQQQCTTAETNLHPTKLQFIRTNYDQLERNLLNDYSLPSPQPDLQVITPRQFVTQILFYLERGFNLSSVNVQVIDRLIVGVRST
jgi:hypothetical protein